ncbi:hypothetical protein ACFPFT_02070 [Tianweitania sediminis]
MSEVNAKHGVRMVADHKCKQAGEHTLKGGHRRAALGQGGLKIA